MRRVGDRGRVTEAAFEEILGGLPSFPPVAMRLVRLVSNEDADVEAVAEIVRSDPALSAELLRRANSAFYGLSRQIDTVEQALVVISFADARRIALAFAGRRFGGRALSLPELRQCWRHSLACAAIAEELAKDSGFAPERAYTAGLMHDLGRLGLLAARGDDYAELIREASAAGPIEDSIYFLDRERDVFGFDHCAAGQWLIERWDMPVELRVVAGRHHDRVSGAEINLREIAALSCRAADALGFPVAPTVTRPPLDRLRDSAPDSLRWFFERAGDELERVVEAKVAALDGELPEAPREPTPVPVKAALEPEAPAAESTRWKAAGWLLASATAAGGLALLLLR